MKVKDNRFQACDDEVGVEPKEDFKITCGVCFRSEIIRKYIQLGVDASYGHGEQLQLAFKRALEDLISGKFDMFLRQSSLGRNSNISDRAFANNMFYKCIICDSQKLFGVPISEAYFEELKTRRNGENVFTPISKWMEDKKKRRLLKSLGYI